jgi:hypothetical protein
VKNLLLVLLLLSGALQRGPELQLNLVAAPPPPPERAEDEHRVHEGCGRGTSDGPLTPFKVTLADTDRLAYNVGDTMTFNVIIENISTAPLVLGISRNPHVAPKTMRPCRVVPPRVHFNVALYAMGKTRPGAPIAITSGYYGSTDVGGTTLVLKPGERVRVQLPAEVRPGPGMEPTLTTDPQSVRIKAFVMIEGESLQAAYSDNVSTIELSHPLDASLPVGQRLKGRARITDALVVAR